METLLAHCSEATLVEQKPRLPLRSYSVRLRRAVPEIAQTSESAPSTLTAVAPARANSRSGIAYRPSELTETLTVPAGSSRGPSDLLQRILSLALGRGRGV